MTYVVAKIFWLLAKPSNVIVLLLGLGVVASWWRRWRTGTVLVTLGTLPLVVLAFLPLGTWLLMPLENRFPPPEPLPREIDGIVVLGGAEEIGLTVARGQPSIDDAAERLTTLIDLARRYPHAGLVFTGRKSATVARDFLAGQGLDVERVVFEGRARDTYENARRAKALVTPKADERWLLVTSAYHMPRSVGVFRAAGWPVVPYPVDYRSPGRLALDFSPNAGTGSRLEDLDFAAREWIGLLAYYLLGRTDALFPAP